MLNLYLDFTQIIIRNAISVFQKPIVNPKSDTRNNSNFINFYGNKTQILIFSQGRIYPIIYRYIAPITLENSKIKILYCLY